MTRIASFNVENLFERPKAFDTEDWNNGEPILKAYQELNSIFAKSIYSNADKARMLQLLVDMDIYFLNAHNAIRRNYTQSPQWAWLRKNKGAFDRQPNDETQNIEIIANGRQDWIGWVELAKEPSSELSIRMTAKVIQEVNAQIIGIVEAEDRPSLVRFNNELLEGLYGHIMLVDGNDNRGIDVGIMTAEDFKIGTIRSNVDVKEDGFPVFSRDCPEYEIQTPNGNTIYVLVNHFKSQTGGGGEKRKQQAKEVRTIVDRLVTEGKHVIVMGDLNEGPAPTDPHVANFDPLYTDNCPLIDCYSLPDFQIGNRPGTFKSCGIRNRLDYIFISKSLRDHYRGGGLFRKGLWGDRVSRPDDWETYPEMNQSFDQASDHALIYVDLDI